jgi:phosphoesterase RecJ-like protein
MNDQKTKIKDQILASKHILVVSHVRPDGDAVGSSLALGLLFQDLGKQTQVVLSDGLPELFTHLPGSEMISTRATGDFDLIICVDCSDIKRTGDALNGYRSPDIVIDHHVTNGKFGKINLIDSQAAATACILMKSIQSWGFTITPYIAASLLTGIITDTLGFRTSNTSPDVLRQSAGLMELGADMNKLYFRGLISRTFSAAKYWGAGLSHLQKANGIVWTELSLSDREKAQYPGNDDADLISMLSSIDETSIAIIFIEQSKGMTKVSWRGLKPGIDVSVIASQFGGGGHKAAAGAELSGSLIEVRERVLKATHLALQLTI